LVPHHPIAFLSHAANAAEQTACSFKIGGKVPVPATRSYQIAVIPGDGIGTEVVPQGIRVLEAAAKRFGFSCTWRNFDWSCEVYRRTGRMMPENGLDQLRPFAAIFLGAVGHPDVPDHISLWGLLIPIRRRFRQYVNLRPVLLLEGLDSPLKNVRPGQIDMVIVRENNEGEYSEIGGRLYAGTDDELAMQQSIFTRRGVDRVLRYAFRLARTRKSHVTSATKSNGIIHTMPYWDERFHVIAQEFPDVRESESRARISIHVRAGARFGAGHCGARRRQPDRANLVGRDDVAAPRRRGGCEGCRAGYCAGAGKRAGAHARYRRQIHHRRHG
jgi:isocitrate dehydrogenase